MNPKFNQMFEQVSLPTGITLKNRIVLAPMTHMSSNADGTISDAELAYYARRTGGAGMSITAVGHVTEYGIGFPAQFGVYDDRFIPGLKKLAETIKQQGSVAVLQIFHAGRLTPEQAVPSGQVVAPSAVASERPGSPEPRELTDAEITSIIKDFGEATRRAIEAGFDGVEIHGANGYLIQQFFSRIPTDVKTALAEVWKNVLLSRLLSWMRFRKWLPNIPNFRSSLVTVSPRRTGNTGTYNGRYVCTGGCIKR